MYIGRSHKYTPRWKTTKSMWKSATIFQFYGELHFFALHQQINFIWKLSICMDGSCMYRFANGKINKIFDCAPNDRRKKNYVQNVWRSRRTAEKEFTLNDRTLWAVTSLVSDGKRKRKRAILFSLFFCAQSKLCAVFNIHVVFVVWNHCSFSVFTIQNIISL